MTTVKEIVLFLLILCFFPITIAAAGQKFPSWMDEAKFQTGHMDSSKSEGFYEPIDPETGKPTSTNPRNNKLFNKPKLPDFKKFREKAMKAKIEKKATGTMNLDSNIDLSITNLSGLKASEGQLDEQIRRAASDVFKNTLMIQKQNLTNKIKALEEIKSLLSGEKVDDPSDVKSAEVKNRIGQLSSYIFNLQKSPSNSLIAPKPLSTEKKAATPSSIPRRFYRPKPFKSFYKEAKEEQNND